MAALTSLTSCYRGICALFQRLNISFNSREHEALAFVIESYGLLFAENVKISEDVGKMLYQKIKKMTGEYADDPEKAQIEISWELNRIVSVVNQFVIEQKLETDPANTEYWKLMQTRAEVARGINTTRQGAGKRVDFGYVSPELCPEWAKAQTSSSTL